ncbi:MAG: cytochrome c oxidase subunit II [Ardenticatenaceae bacterium]|nr:cytochrome c oxidase subunit II [Anaerolineales bacterium]MCB8920901.1 cytochrome c oxidase subunit II [Ardenticatenaceae bacterium]
MGKYKHFIIVAVLVVLTTLGLKFLVFGPMFQLPVQASEQGVSIDTMFEGHFWMISFLFALIMVLVFYSAVVFRRKPGDETDGPHVHGNTALEIIWTVVPVFAVVGFGIWGGVTLKQLLSPVPDEMTIKVTGRQWAWSFQYPEYEDINSAELVLLKDQPVVLELSSSDVLHSFWVPEFRVKQDAVPGRTTTLRITPTMAGEYKVRCAEICGFDHANMLAPVRVLEQAEFTAWADERMNAPKFGEMTPEERGALWYSNEGFACEGCHTIDGTAATAPSWLSVYGRSEQLTDGTTVTVDDAYIRQSILDPQSQIVAGFEAVQMPADFGDQFSAKQAEIAATEGVEIDIINDIIAYMQTLK